MRTAERVSAELERLAEIDRDKFYFPARREFCVRPNGRDRGGEKHDWQYLTYRRGAVSGEELLLIVTLRGGLRAERVAHPRNRGAETRISLKPELSWPPPPLRVVYYSRPLDIIVARGRLAIERASIYTYICVRRLLSRRICDYAGGETSQDTWMKVDHACVRVGTRGRRLRPPFTPIDAIRSPDLRMRPYVRKEKSVSRSNRRYEMTRTFVKLILLISVKPLGLFAY